jgi:hypothetical protein
MALLGGTMAASSELAKQLHYAQPVHLSYFEGPPYDLYATNVGDNFFLTLIYDRRKEASRIGLVWLYTQRALSEIKELLERETGTNTAVLSLDGNFAQSVQHELDSLLGEDVVKPAKTTLSSPKKLFPLPIIPFRERVNKVLTQFGQQTGMIIESYLEALDIPIPVSATTLIMKVVSEGLKNVHRHSKATILGVSFHQDGRWLNGRIADNGVGFDMKYPPEWHTLGQLQQAIEKAGGQMELSAHSQQGTKLSFRLPI